MVIKFYQTPIKTLPFIEHGITVKLSVTGLVLMLSVKLLLLQLLSVQDSRLMETHIKALFKDGSS